jgi:hypothetical protein
MVRAVMRTLLLLGTVLLAASCGGDDDDDSAIDASPGTAADASQGVDAAVAEDLDMQAGDFACILEGTKAHQFFVWNPLGHLDDSVAVVNSKAGGTYPVGTVLQLIPTEAMVKRAEGWSPSTNDWEFFSLEVSDAGTTIMARGTTDVVNAFNGNCFECHSAAEPQWDLICENSHGCDPLPVTDDIIEQLQNSDPRCK